MKITKEQAIQMAEKCGFEHVDHIKYRGRFNRCTVSEKDQINRFHALVQAAYENGRKSALAQRDELLEALRHIEGAAMDITCERRTIRDAARAAIAKAESGAT